MKAQELISKLSAPSADAVFARLYGVSAVPAARQRYLALAAETVAAFPETADDLLEQPYIKDAAKTVHNLLDEAAQKFGERTEISRFARLSAR